MTESGSSDFGLSHQFGWLDPVTNAPGCVPTVAVKPLSTIFVWVAAVLILSSSIARNRLESQASVVQTTARQAIYAADPDDAWNRIFYCLFSRTVKAHPSSDLDVGAPSTRIRYSQFPHELSVSKRLFERVEIGDRAIEPLYPSFITSLGVSEVLSQPLYSQLRQALTEALAEERARPPLDRALMQSDIWAAYDVMFQNSFSDVGSQQLHERRNQLLVLLARLINKLALTHNEIEALPDNYAAAARSYQLPELFDQRSGWVEVQWRPDRFHDHAADYRRATRIFIKPTEPPQDKQKFLNSLRNAPDITSRLAAVALVTQDLLVDRDGKVVPSRLTYDVQLRRFIKNERGALIKTGVEEYELSRRLLINKPASGGLVSLDDKAPVYLPEAGDDYGFASLQRNHGGDTSPIVATLRARCISCHGQDVAAVFTFNTVLPQPFPPVAQLDPLSNDHAFFVAHRKMEREDFRALHQQDGTR